MTEQNNQMRGLILTINDSGRVAVQPLGKLNEAEFLGLGAYLSNIVTRDGLIGLGNSQVNHQKALQEIISILGQLAEVQVDERKEECLKEQPSESLPSEDSLSFTENSQESSEE